MGNWPDPVHPYAELGARSNFSLLDGASHPAELVLTAKALGHAGLGLCDRNSLAGVVRGHLAAQEAGLPFRVGARLALEDGSEFLAWPTDRAGYGRLTNLLSRGRMRAPKGECSISLPEMLEHARNWCLAAIPPRRPEAGFASRFVDLAERLQGRLALPFFCAAAPYLDGQDAERLRWLAGLAKAAGAGAALLAWNDLRYHHRRRRPLADLLTAIRLGCTVDALGPLAEPNAERCLKRPSEMTRLFEAQPEALINTQLVLEATGGFSLDQLRHEYPDEILEPGRTPQETLAGRVWQAAAERWPEGVPAGIRKRLNHELRLIEQLDYAPYFLTVHEVVRFAQEREILCQGRGSAANSTCCYVLGITSVDPDKHDLLFERFVSASRGEPPDIDVDFEHERREEVIQHIYDRYGRERAAIAGTVIRFRVRSALREAGKAMGLSEDVTARLAKASWGPGREQSLPELARGLGLDPADTRLGWTLRLAEEIQDFPRHLATHVGGFVISRGPLTELAVIGSAAMPRRTVLEWDKDDIDALGLLKVDILALGMLSLLRRGFDLLRHHHRLALGLASLPGDCPETYAMLRRADSIGVFQVESRAQMNMLPRLRPETFYDLVIQVAIIRPGPIQGDMVHPYLRRRWGLEQPVYPGPSGEHGKPDELRVVLERTLGVPLFQEQAMRVAMVAAEFTPGEADRLRRAMATFKHTQGVTEHRERLVGGMVRRGYDPALAERVFQQLEGFGSYGFPESHAASFAQLAYASAWLKCHHPAVFATALLNSQPMGFYAPAQIVRDARDHGVVVRPLDVNRSAWDCTLEPAQESAEGLALRLGLRMVAGLARAEAERIIEARQAGNGSPFASLEEVVRRAGLSRRGTEALAAANGFAGTGIARRQALWAARGVEKAPPPLLLLAAQSAAAGEPPLLPEAAPALPEEREGQAVVLDYLATGLTLRQHPLALLRQQLRALGCQDTREINALPSGQRVLLAGLVLMRQRPGTSKGVVFVTVEDEFGTANLVVFAKIVDRDRTALVNARLLLVQGRIERETEQAEVPVTHIIAERLADRTNLLQELNAAEPEDWGAAALGRADEVRRPEPGSRRPALNLRSRDFQ